MKKIIVIVSMLAVFLSSSAVAEAPNPQNSNWNFHDLVYRGEKLKPIYEIPKNEVIYLNNSAYVITE